MISIIYLKNVAIITKEEYEDHFEFQDRYEDYVANLGWSTTEELIQFIKNDFGLTPENEERLRRHISKLRNGKYLNLDDYID